MVYIMLSQISLLLHSLHPLKLSYSFEFPAEFHSCCQSLSLLHEAQRRMKAGEIDGRLDIVQKTW